jgi:RHH-type proline utilization regulon transcriptional repressor/proline dehydrogenase/delta 1-pyrroline-5-carboxylate dehydrogenase
MAALATGNRIRFADDALTQRLLASLPAEVVGCVEREAGGFESGFDAVLFDGTDEEADAWRVRLAQRSGPILPLLRPEPEYDPARLVHERTLSVNTAAAGGNASLMAMGL